MFAAAIQDQEGLITTGIVEETAEVGDQVKIQAKDENGNPFEAQGELVAIFDVVC